MLYNIPYYYSQFTCTGSSCKDTCCKGWRIGIDEKSYRRYMQVPGAFGERLRRGIDHRDRSFRLKDRACTLLDEEGLCWIQKELGKRAMCQTCRLYPRHREDYGELQEMMLSLSCPEAARLILTDSTQGACIQWQKPEEAAEEKADSVSEGDNGTEEVCDPQKLHCFEEIRLAMMCIIKNRSIPWNQRLAMILAYAHDFQRHMDQAGPEADLNQLVERWNRRYLAPEAVSAFAEKLKPWQGRDHEQMLRICAWMRDLQKLEPVLACWKQKQGRICTALYHQESPASYRKLEQAFGKAAADLEAAWENLVLYFLRTWLLGAVYDNDIYGKVKLTVFSSLVIREWCLFQYRKTGRIRERELAAAAYRYSREVENSDANLEMLEGRLADSPLYSLSSMLTVLCGRMDEKECG